MRRMFYHEAKMTQPEASHNHLDVPLPTLETSVVSRGCCTCGREYEVTQNLDSNDIGDLLFR